MKVLRNTFLSSMVLAAVLSTAITLSAGPAKASEDGASWNPQSSERLVKLPARYLNKSLDQSFAGSTLGQALSQSEEDISLKSRTLKDLQQASAQSTGDLRMEMRHQFLAEKRAYLELMTARNDIRRQKLTTKVRVIEQTQAQLLQAKAPDTPALRELIENQEAARQRFSSSLSKVDMTLFQSASAPESQYAAKYADNMVAVEQLMSRIANHKMNQTSGLEGEVLTKEEYLRQVVSDAQAELALIDQEDEILGYMAKLVALDAMALSEEAMDAEFADADPSLDIGASPSQTVQFFLNN